MENILANSAHLIVWKSTINSNFHQPNYKTGMSDSEVTSVIIRVRSAFVSISLAGYNAPTDFSVPSRCYPLSDWSITDGEKNE